MATDDLMRLQAIPKAQFDPTTLTSDYQALNGSGFADNIKILKMYNPSTTISVDLSLDGVTDHDFLPPLGTVIIDLQTNHADGPIYGTGTLYGAQGQIIYGKTAAEPSYLQIIGFR